MSSEHDELVEVRLVRFPLRVYARATEHGNELLREFALLTASTPADSHAVPARLLELVEELSRRYPRQTDHEAEREAALARGDREADFSIKVPTSAAEAGLALDALLAEAEDYCRAGALLTLAPPPDVAAFRRWYLRELAAQIRGAAPTPWPGDLD